MENEADAVISAELEGLTDEYRRDGLSGLADELSFRADSWGQTGAVYLLVDANLVKEGGNLTSWPFDGIPNGQWAQFDLKSPREDDKVRMHPVRASLSLLPDGHRLLVGIDVTQQRRFASTFRYATLWGIGLTALAGAIAGYFLSRKLTRRVQSVAATCDAIVGGDLDRRLPVDGSQDEFDALASAVNNMVDRLAENAQLLRATFDSAAHDLRGPLYRLRGRLEDASRMPTTEPPVRAGIDAALTELDRVQRTLATLLQIAQAESGMAAANLAAVDLGGADHRHRRAVRAGGAREEPVAAGAGGRQLPRERQPAAAGAAGGEPGRELPQIHRGRRPHRRARAARRRDGVADGRG